MTDLNREKFIRLVEKRVNNAIKTIRLIGNLSNRNTYSYQDKDVEKIFRALDKELKASKARFESGTRADTPEFKLL